MAEAQGLDHLCLHRRHVLVGLVGTKRRANDGAGSDGLPDIVREIRGVDMKVLNMASGFRSTCAGTPHEFSETPRSFARSVRTNPKPATSKLRVARTWLLFQTAGKTYST